VGGDGCSASSYEDSLASSAAPILNRPFLHRGIQVHRGIQDRFDLDPIAQVHLLCPRTRGGYASRSLNIELQQLRNPDLSKQGERFRWRFAPDDKVKQIANDDEKEVFKGDVGLVGKAYTAQLGLKPGDEFEIKLPRKQIQLIPLGAAGEE
jgi:ATP-dependent exoDNAse (exonuclease V) alpha subunit